MDHTKLFEELRFPYGIPEVEIISGFPEHLRNPVKRPGAPHNRAHNDGHGFPGHLRHELAWNR
jgi:hypothetical protein